MGSFFKDGLREINNQNTTPFYEGVQKRLGKWMFDGKPFFDCNYDEQIKIGLFIKQTELIEHA